MRELSNEIISFVSYILFLFLSLFPNSWRLAALEVSCSIIDSGFVEPYQTEPSSKKKTSLAWELLYTIMKRLIPQLTTSTHL